MPNLKITELPESTGIADGDLLVIVAIAGTPTTSKITKANAITALLAAHLAAGDPHPGYQLESEKGANNGYASLDGSGDVPDVQIPPGIARDSEVATAISDHESAIDPHPLYATDSDLTNHVIAADPHAVYQKESEKDAAFGYPGLNGSSKIAGAQQTYGSAVNTACEGNDARLSDARNPLAHAASHQEGSDPYRPTFLPMGGITTSFPALKRNGTDLEVKLGDDSGFAGFVCNNAVVIDNVTKYTGGGVPTSGAFRVGGAASGSPIVVARNAADGADLTLLARDGSDRTTTQGQIIETQNNKGAASGYASLDGSVLVPFAQLGSGTPSGSKFLRDDRTWAVPAGGGGGTDEVLLVPASNKSIPANNSVIVGDYYRLDSGIQLLIESGANLTVT